MSAPAPQRRGRPQILLIDDSPIDRRLLASHLSYEPVDIAEAEDGPSGLALAREAQPDLILLDLTMPGWDGFETLGHLQDDPRTASIPVIFLSAATSTKVKAHGLELGAVDYVGKPFDSVELRARVRVGLRLKFLLDTLERQAEIDGLTELGNRRALATWLERLGRAGPAAGAAPDDLAVILLDLDHFKRINDTHGHPAGDDVLRAAAAILRDASREGDFVGRLGGEEFVILAPGCPLDGALGMGERLRMQVADASIRARGKPIALTASVGATARGDSGAGIEILLQEADRALAAAKQSGRNATRVWDRAAARAVDPDFFPLPRNPAPPPAPDAPGWNWQPRIPAPGLGRRDDPAEDAPAQAPPLDDWEIAPQRGASDLERGRRILLIDDSELDRKVLQVRLNLEGAELIETGDPIAGLKLARTIQPDLILLDLLIPGMNGYQALKHLKNDPTTRSVPVIFISSEGATQARAFGLDLGAVDFITKPFDAVELRARVRAAFRTKRMQDMLERRAKIDNLTGLANRQALDGRYRELRQSARVQPLSLVMLDLDGFKGINENSGHAAGDEVLRRVAEILRSVARPEDLAARYGGEEFALLMPGAGLEEAAARAEEARKALASAPIPFNCRPIPATASFGASSVLVGQGPYLPQDLLERADAALYAAKGAGGNSVWAWDGQSRAPTPRTPPPDHGAARA